LKTTVFSRSLVLRTASLYAPPRYKAVVIARKASLHKAGCCARARAVSTRSFSEMESASAAFVVEHDDPAIGLRRRFVLSFYESDNTVSMYDPHGKKSFLTRTVPPEKPRLDAFYLGATVVICSRPLTVIDYADEHTRRRFAAVRGTAVLLVKPEAYYSAGKIVDRVYAAGLSVGRLRMVKFTHEDAAAFAAAAGAGSEPSGGASDSKSSTSARAAPSGVLSGGGGLSEEAAHLCADHMLALEVAGDDVLARLQAEAGPADPAVAREVDPYSLR